MTVHTHYSVTLVSNGRDDVDVVDDLRRIESHVNAYLYAHTAIYATYRGNRYTALVLRTDACDDAQAEWLAKYQVGRLDSGLLATVYVGQSRERAQIKARELTGGVSITV